MKKVLFVATVVKAHIMVFHIPYLKWFKDNGYETYVCARNDYEDSEKVVIPYCDNYYDMPFERSPFKIENIITYNKLRKLINSKEFDIIHCHTPIGGVLSRLAARNARKKNTTVIYTAHGFHFYKGANFLNWLLYYPVERWLARFTDVLVTINIEDFNRAKKFKAKRIEYVPGVGIEKKRYSEITTNREWKLNTIGLPKDAFVILSVGELNKNKNHETIIRAVAKLENAKIYYVICGRGPLENYLRDLTKELEIDNQIKLLGYRSDISEICKVSDVFALPSFREGLSLALMEAMAAGLPIVCSNIRGNSDLIKHDIGGFLAESNDVTSFTDAINTIYKSEDLRYYFGNNNLKSIEKYSIENVMNEMGGVYLPK